MRRKFSRGPRSMVRPVDWDYAQGGATLATGTLTWDWIRCPSGTVDPSSDMFITPKTLIRTLLFWDAEVQVTNAHTRHSLFFGIIAWDGRSASPPSAFLDTPDVSNGALDWVIWLPGITVSTEGNAFGSLKAHTSSAFNSSGPFYESKAQRKLPEGTGLLWIAYFEGGTGSVCDFDFSVRAGLKGDFSAPGLGGS